MSKYNILISTNEATVVSEYEPQKKRSCDYQSEAALEKEFIKLLSEQGYQYVYITSSNEMIWNLREQLERLNKLKFTDNEWNWFFNNCISNKNEGIEDKAKKIQEDHVQTLKRDDGSTKNIFLIDKKNIHNNFLQVINQYEENSGNYKNRYDVTILINGIPIIHVELKRRGVALKEAFNQIDRYQRDSFWAGNGLYEYVQIFVISNGTNTKYYSNTTRFSAIKERENGKRKANKTSNSFEFTSFWADSQNRIIPDLIDFTKTFFAKHTILNILTRYCVFTSEKLLLVMRPYQIVATERILNRIEISKNYKKMGTLEAGGYIWHTTGSGKTLTSFKTAQLASKIDYVDKVLFVVDRKDLDYQTIKEYDRFEKGAANGNKNTRTLKRQLEDRDEKSNFHEYKIIVTTIQKLDRFIDKNDTHPIYNKHIVMIFDECHRNQFGSMHKAIVKKFKKYNIFGFTGTPIFKENAVSGGDPSLKTTEQAFGDKLHTYTIVDAIGDGNVLPFRIDYVNTIKTKDGISDKKVNGINIEEALLAPERISAVTKYILEHFNQKTKRNDGHYTFSKVVNISEISKNNQTKEEKERVRLSGFNSIFAVSSIDAAKLYYLEFKKQMEKDLSKKLKVSLIYSYGVNEENVDGVLDDENSDSTEGLSASSRDFLEMAIKDYNEEFGTSYDTSNEKFPNFYKDLSLRMKNRELDLLIVVNMFLTGFDATTLNTLWVDKNLKMHGLIQAFSRTNRILNSVKTFGNIVCFRNLQEETDRAIGLFGDRYASGVVILKSYNDYYYGYEDENGKHHKGYDEKIEELIEKFPLGKPIIGEENQKEFITLFGSILRLKNILSSFDDFEGNEILKPIDMQDYTGKYNDLYDEFRKKRDRDKENINDDIIFEMELVKQVEVNIDYILNLVIKYHQSNCKNKEILVAIDKAIKSSLELRSKKKLIDDFVNTINAGSEVIEDWRKFVVEEREKDIVNLIKEENLQEDEFRKFVKNIFRNGEVKTTGTDIDKIMPKMSRFGNNDRQVKKNRIINKIKTFFEKYFGLIHKEDVEKQLV